MIAPAVVVPGFRTAGKEGKGSVGVNPLSKVAPVVETVQLVMFCPVPFTIVGMVA